MKKVLFYSSVPSKKLFYTQRFYYIDISLLQDLGCEVILSNHILDALLFWKYDFVFAYFYRKSFFVGLLARLLRKNVYFTGGIDDLDKEYASFMRYHIQKIFMKLCYFVATSCIIVSKADMNNVIKVLRTKNKLSYSEHTIDITNFMKDEIVKENFFTTIVWMGNVNNVKRKGVDIALYVFSVLKQNTLFSDYKFIIIGKVGEGTSYLRSLIVKYNLTNDVIITDEISETSKIDYLKRSKYYFQLSFYEGFGLAALEALVAKNIVIHSAKGGLSNPVFASGIHFNIEHDKRIESRKLLDTLTYYTSSKEEANVQYMYQYYNNKRRKDDFMKIIIDLIF